MTRGRRNHVGSFGDQDTGNSISDRSCSCCLSPKWDLQFQYMLLFFLMVFLADWVDDYSPFYTLAVLNLHRSSSPEGQKHRRPTTSRHASPSCIYCLSNKLSKKPSGASINIFHLEPTWGPGRIPFLQEPIAKCFGIGKGTSTSPGKEGLRGWSSTCFFLLPYHEPFFLFPSPPATVVCLETHKERRQVSAVSLVEQ